MVPNGGPFCYLPAVREILMTKKPYAKPVLKKQQTLSSVTAAVTSKAPV
jgi:hypothetical protein